MAVTATTSVADKRFCGSTARLRIRVGAFLGGAAPLMPHSGFEFRSETEARYSIDTANSPRRPGCAGIV